jgi:hypothetical protein
MSNLGSTLLDGVATAQGIYAPMGDITAADWYVAESRNEGWYVAQGCQVSVSGTAGKVDMSAGIILVGQTEVNVAAVTAFSTSITTLASGLSSGQALWAALEVDITGTLNVNAGSAGASDATHSPVKPTPTSARVVVAWLFVPFGATAVDLLYANSNTKAKILPAQQLAPGESPAGWQYEQGSWVYGIGTSSVISCVGMIGDKSGTYRPGTKLSWNDGTNTPGYGVVYTASVGATLTGVSSNTTTNVFTKNTHGFSNLNLSCIVITAGLAMGGISLNTLYWVNYIDANTFTLALTIGGTAIDITGTADTNLTFSPATSIFMIPSSDYYVRNATISRVRYSYAAAPQGFPTWFTWAPTASGWTPGASDYRWCAEGRKITLNIQQTAGTSSSATHTLTLPVAAVTRSNYVVSVMAWGIDSGTGQYGLWQIVSGGSTIAAYCKGSTVTNTASGNSAMSGQIVYEY